MTTRLAGQFASNMLRCTILVLQLFGLLATCCSTVLYRSTHSELSIAPVDCSQSDNSTECATKNVRDIEGRSNEAVSTKEVRMIRLKESENDDVAVEEGELCNVLRVKYD